MRMLYVTNGVAAMSIRDATFEQFKAMVASLPDDVLSHKLDWNWDIDSVNYNEFALYPENRQEDFTSLAECEMYIRNDFTVTIDDETH